MEQTLIKAIEESAAAATAAGRPSAAEVYLATLRPLRPYIQAVAGADDVSLLSVLAPGFATGFRKYLEEEYIPGPKGRKATATTVKRHVENLRAVCRGAINALRLPNLEIFAEEPYSPTPELKQLRGKAQAEFGRIVETFGHLVHNAAISTDPAHARLHHTKAQTLGRLILGTLSHGSGIAGPWLTPDQVPDHLEGLAVNYATPITDMELAERNTRILLTDIGVDADTWLRHNRAVWLQLALDMGASPRDVRLAIGTVPATEPDGAAIARVTLAAMQAFRLHVKTWFAIKSFGMNGEELAKEIKNLIPHDIYVPKDIHARERAGRVVQYNNPVIDNLLFVRADRQEARRIAAEIHGMGMFYGTRDDKGGRVFSPIPDSQMRVFMKFLGAAGSNVIALDPEKEYRGRRVRITGGRFEGCEGTIETVQIDYGKEGLTRQIRCFAVRFEWACIYGTVDFDPRYVEEID